MPQSLSCLDFQGDFVFLFHSSGLPMKVFQPLYVCSSIPSRLSKDSVRSKRLSTYSKSTFYFRDGVKLPSRCLCCSTRLRKENLTKDSILFSYLDQILLNTLWYPVTLAIKTNHPTICKNCLLYPNLLTHIFFSPEYLQLCLNPPHSEASYLAL